MTIRDDIEDGLGWWDIKAKTGCSNAEILEEYRAAYIEGDTTGDTLRAATKALKNEPDTIVLRESLRGPMGGAGEEGKPREEVATEYARRGKARL